MARIIALLLSLFVCSFAIARDTGSYDAVINQAVLEKISRVKSKVKCCSGASANVFFGQSYRQSLNSVVSNKKEVALLKGAGFTPADYVKSTYSLVLALDYVSDKKSGKDAHLSPVQHRNIEFVRHNYKKIKALALD